MRMLFRIIIFWHWGWLYCCGLHQDKINTAPVMENPSSVQPQTRFLLATSSAHNKMKLSHEKLLTHKLPVHFLHKKFSHLLPLPFFLLIYDIITWSEHNNLEAHLQHHLFRPRVLIKYNWSITSKSPSQPSRIAACWKALLLFLNCFSFYNWFTPKVVQ